MTRAVLLEASTTLKDAKRAEDGVPSAAAVVIVFVGGGGGIGDVGGGVAFVSLILFDAGLLADSRWFFPLTDRWGECGFENNAGNLSAMAEFEAETT